MKLFFLHCFVLFGALLDNSVVLSLFLWSDVLLRHVTFD